MAASGYGTCVVSASGKRTGLLCPILPAHLHSSNAAEMLCFYMPWVEVSTMFLKIHGNPLHPSRTAIKRLAAPCAALTTSLMQSCCTNLSDAKGVARTLAGELSFLRALFTTCGLCFSWSLLLSPLAFHRGHRGYGSCETVCVHGLVHSGHGHALD